MLIDQVINDLEQKTSSIKEVADFLYLAKSRNIPITFATELALGVKSDLCSVRTQNQDELLRYCYRVASTVGIMICYLLGLRESKAIAFGIDLGIAMQLTNIARDVLEDYANDRIYLPTDLISEKIVAQASSGSLKEQVETFEIIKQVIKLADVYYDSAENGICYLPKFARLAVMVSSRSYRKIGQNIIKNRKNYFKKRISTSDIQKQICLAEAIFSLFTNPKYQRVSNSLSHRSELHSVLRGFPGFDRVYS
jgi:phytoene synthase